MYLAPKSPPVMTWQWVKLTSRLRCNETEKALLSGEFVVSLVCARSFICLGIFLCTHVSMWHVPIISWATSQLRPPLWTRGRTASSRPRSKMGMTSADNMRMSMKKDILLCVNTRNTVKSPDKGLVVGVHKRPAGLRLWARRKTWRPWVCVKLQRLCARLRVGDIWTHSGVNSWPFRYRVCEQALVACLHAHLSEGLNHLEKKNSLDNRNSVNR